VEHGNASFNGTPGDTLNLTSAATPWHIMVLNGGSLSANYVRLSHSDALSGGGAQAAR